MWHRVLLLTTVIIAIGTSGCSSGRPPAHFLHPTYENTRPSAVLVLPALVDAQVGTNLGIPMSAEENSAIVTRAVLKNLQDRGYAATTVDPYRTELAAHGARNDVQLNNLRASELAKLTGVEAVAYTAVTSASARWSYTPFLLLIPLPQYVAEVSVDCKLIRGESDRLLWQNVARVGGTDAGWFAAPLARALNPLGHLLSRTVTEAYSSLPSR